MGQTTDISILNLLIGYASLSIPILIFLYYKTGLFKSTIIAITRMTIQMAAVAVYLEYIFELNSAWINSAWVIVMVVVSAFVTIFRSDLKLKYLLFPLLLSGFVTIIITDAFFLGLVIQLDNVFDARYFIPISGMVLGNILKHNIIGMNTYFYSLKKDNELYQFLLINNNSRKNALFPFLSEAIKKAMNPYIGAVSVMGLISLPGMMTGQIIGGSSPEVAIRYQIMIMLCIFVACIVNLFLSLWLSNRFVFDSYGNLKEGVLKS